MVYRLLSRFEEIFRRGPYLHRNANLGDSVAVEFYEDMYSLARSAPYNRAVDQRSLVVNTTNKITGKTSRRGDGTLGDLVPGVPPEQLTNFQVWRGPTATMRVGVEVKILAKSMIKQIDRVMNDLRKQADEFVSLTAGATKVALVGLNWSEKYSSFEGERRFPAERAPSSEAGEAKRRIQQQVSPKYHELLFLEFKATNEPPYDFVWINSAGTLQQYASALLRVSQQVTTQLANEQP